MICNVEFDPARTNSKNFCAKHCAPTPQKKGLVAKVDSGLRAIMGLAALTVLSTVLFAIIYGCAESSGLVEFEYPSGVLDHKISIIDGNTELDVTLKLNGWDAGENDIYSAILDMQSIMRHELKEGGSEQSILFRIVGVAATDDYGRETTDLIGVFDIQYSMKDIKQINWDNPGEIRLLNLGHVSGITPAGITVAQRYCEKEREHSQAFCDSF
jgi:hypothetical protein